MYYALAVCDRLQLDPGEVQAFISGEPENTGEFFQLLRDYVLQVSWSSRPDVFEYSDVLDAVPPHHYFNLFSVALCGS